MIWGKSHWYTRRKLKSSSLVLLFSLNESTWSITFTNNLWAEQYVIFFTSRNRNFTYTSTSTYKQNLQICQNIKKNILRNTNLNIQKELGENHCLDLKIKCQQKQSADPVLYLHCLTQLQIECDNTRTMDPIWEPVPRKDRGGGRSLLMGNGNPPL